MTKNSVTLTIVVGLVLTIACLNLATAVSDKCVRLSTQNAPFCSDVIDYPVLEKPDQSINARDSMARVASQSGSEETPKCGFYANPDYQCRKIFPRCVHTNSGLRERKMCSSTCLFGLRWKQRQCRFFSDDYFFMECSNTKYYSDQATGDNPCEDVPVELLGEPNRIKWKELTAGVMFLLAIYLGVSTVKSYLSDRRLRNELNEALNVQMSKEKAASSTEILLGNEPTTDLLSSQQSRRNELLTEEYKRKGQTNEKRSTVTTVESPTSEQNKKEKDAISARGETPNENEGSDEDSSVAAKDSTSESHENESTIRQRG